MKTTQTIRAIVNGEERELALHSTVRDVVALFSPTPVGTAVALNGELVTKSTWDRVDIAPGDRLEILTMAPGG